MLTRYPGATVELLLVRAAGQTWGWVEDSYFGGGALDACVMKGRGDDAGDEVCEGRKR